MIAGEGMPMYKNIENKGRLFIKFTIDFPTYKDIEPHVQQLREKLPGPKEAPPVKATNKKNARKKNRKKNNKKNGDKEAETNGEPEPERVAVTAASFDMGVEADRAKKARRQQREEEEARQQEEGGGCVHQ